MEWTPLTVQTILLGVAIVSAIVGYLGVRNTITSNRRIARQRATLDFVNQYNDDSRVSRGHRVVHLYNGEPLDEYLKLGSDNRDHFLFLMNKFEILAVGLNHEIYDESMVIDVFGDEFRDIYEIAKPLTAHIRKINGSAFQQLEVLASKTETRHAISH